MRKILSILILSFFLNFDAHSQKYSVGQQIHNEIIVSDQLKIKLQGDGWYMVRKEFYPVKDIRQKVWGFIKIENNEFIEGYDIYQGDMGAAWIGTVDLIIVEIVFKDKYDGCYERPEYFLLEVYKKGRTHNCMIVGHWDLNKEIYNPDDPRDNAVATGYRQFIKKNSIKLPKIVLASTHSYFSRHNRSNWYQIVHFINPKLLNGPKNKFFTEESSEYHKYNISDYPKHQKTMDEFISISSQFHKEFESMLKAKKNHLLDIDKYISENKKKNTDKEITKQLKQLGDLYKSGVLSKEEFEKAKKKILN